MALTVYPDAETECLLSIGLREDICPTFALLGKVLNRIGAVFSRQSTFEKIRSSKALPQRTEVKGQALKIGER